MAHDNPRPRMLRGDEAELFNTYSHRLERAVGSAVNASDALIEDACSFAWLQLLRLQPDRTETLFAWLYTVALRQAWRLSRQERRTDHLEVIAPNREPADQPTERIADAHEALATLAALPDRQRHYLTLVVSGHSYDEIAAHCDVSRTAVNRYLTRARRTVRHLRAVD